jgi:hypothetical protein
MVPGVTLKYTYICEAVPTPEPTAAPSLPPSASPTTAPTEALCVDTPPSAAAAASSLRMEKSAGPAVAIDLLEDGTVD